MDLVAVAVARNNVRDAILSCNRCRLSPLHPDHPASGTVSRGPVPFIGPTPARVMLLTDSPDIIEARTSRAFTGPANKKLFMLMAEVGLDFRDMFMTHVIQCLPPQPTNVPSPHDIIACEKHLRSMRDVCDPEWVITLGSIPLRSVGVRAKITDIHGRPFKMWYGPFRDRWIFPTFHPGALVHDKTDRRANELSADLSTASRLLRGTLSVDEVKVEIGRGGKPEATRT